MSTSNAEGMKKLIAEKAKRSAEQNHRGDKPSPKLHSIEKVFKRNKRGGLFDK